MAIVFLPVKPKALGDVFPYFFKETYVTAVEVCNSLKGLTACAYVHLAMTCRNVQCHGTIIAGICAIA